MAEFIEVTEHASGKKNLINVEHIMKIRPDESGSYIFFVAMSGSNGTVSPNCIHVTESYSFIKRILGI